MARSALRSARGMRATAAAIEESLKTSLQLNRHTHTVGLHFTCALYCATRRAAYPCERRRLGQAARGEPVERVLDHGVSTLWQPGARLLADHVVAGDQRDRTPWSPASAALKRASLACRR